MVRNLPNDHSRYTTLLGAQNQVKRLKGKNVITDNELFTYILKDYNIINSIKAS